MYRKITLLMLTSLLLVGCINQVDNQENDEINSQNTTSLGYNSSMNSKVNAYSEAPAMMSAGELTNKTAIIHTSKGDIEIELFGDVAPLTVSNFIFLSEEKFYDGLTFHRREEGFVIQGGDPAGNGTGGPGYTVPAEINSKEHVKGAVAMARLGDAVNPTKASSGSQFYITLAPAHFLDDEYTIFGQVISGMDIADQIKVGDEIISIEIR